MFPWVHTTWLWYVVVITKYRIPYPWPCKVWQTSAHKVEHKENILTKCPKKFKSLAWTWQSVWNILSGSSHDVWLPQLRLLNLVKLTKYGTSELLSEEHNNIIMKILVPQRKLFLYYVENFYRLGTQFQQFSLQVEFSCCLHSIR